MRSSCPINFGLELFGDKWTLLVVRDLMFFGKRYYNEFLNSSEGISTNILADRLQMLEQHGFIKKGKDEAHKQKIVYRLTEKGIDLLPLLNEIGAWSEKYGADVLKGESQTFIEELKKEMAGGMEEIKRKLLAEHQIS